MLKGKLDRSIVHLPEEVDICPSCKEETMEGLVSVTPSVMRKCKKEFRTALSKWHRKRICISCVNVDLLSARSTSRNKICLKCGVCMSRYNLGDLCYCCKDNSMDQNTSDLIQIAKGPEATFIKGVSTAKYLSSSSPGKTMKLKGSGGKRRLPVLPCLREEAIAQIKVLTTTYSRLERKYLNLKKDRDRRAGSLQKPVDPVYRIEQESLIHKLTGRMSLLCEELDSAHEDVSQAQRMLQMVSEIAKDVVKISSPGGKYSVATNQSIGWSINKRKRPKSRRNRKHLSRKDRRQKGGD